MAKKFLKDCCDEEYGCCPDGKTAKTDSLGTNCPCTCWKHPSSVRCPEPQCVPNETKKCCQKKCNKKSKYDNGFDSCICDKEENNLLSLISNNESLSTFYTALQMTPSFQELSNDSNYTVFAPNNDSFTNIPNLDSILEDMELLTSIIKLHIIPGKIASLDIPGNISLQSLNGQMIDLTNNNGVSISSGNTTATVISADNIACNGIVHIIDNVLLPVNNSESSGGGGTDNNVILSSNIPDKEFYSKIYRDEY